MNASRLRIAAAQYPLDLLTDWADYRSKIREWVARAVNEKAGILVFPEYGSIELATLFGREVCSSLPLLLDQLQQCRSGFLTLYRELAVRYGVYICAGSYPVRTPDGHYCNRSDFFFPDGRTDYQDKLQMTRFERERWGISRGSRIKVFDTDYGKVGIAICYDIEFPLMARYQATRGAVLILTPSCTDTLSAYHRVRIGCQARALENQCIVVQSPMVGICDWSEAVDVGIGAAAVYTPADIGFPPDGVLTTGELNIPGWVCADIDLNAIRTVRTEGNALNYHDWDRQVLLYPQFCQNPK